MMGYKMQKLRNTEEKCRATAKMSELEVGSFGAILSEKAKQTCKLKFMIQMNIHK